MTRFGPDLNAPSTTTTRFSPDNTPRLTDAQVAEIKQGGGSVLESHSSESKPYTPSTFFPSGNERQASRFNIKIPFTADKYLSLPSPFANIGPVFGSSDNTPQLLEAVANLPSDILQTIPQAAVTAYEELGPQFGKASTTKLSPFLAALYGKPEYTTASQDIQNRIARGDGVLASYIGAISQKTLDVASGGLLLAAGLRLTGKLISKAGDVSLIESWRTLGSPTTEAELQSNYKNLARQFHPDLTGGSDGPIKIINKAKEVLDSRGIPSAIESLRINASQYADALGRETKLGDSLLSPNFSRREITAQNIEAPQLPGYRPEGGEIKQPIGLSTQSVEPVGFGGETSSVPKIPEDLQPLAEEARKYKSAEEFVAAQSQGQFHGTSNPLEKMSSGDSMYSTMNIYGQGFYTTDNLGIAEGYTKKGRGGQPSIYKVSEKEAVPLYDIEKPMDADILAKVNKFDIAQNSTPWKQGESLRQVYYDIRELSGSGEFSADTVQEYFDALRTILESKGYRGIEHVGGKLTGKDPHAVKIYWNPEKDLTISEGADKKSLTDFYTQAVGEKGTEQLATPTKANIPAGGTPEAKLDQLLTERETLQNSLSQTKPENLELQTARVKNLDSLIKDARTAVLASKSEDKDAKSLGYLLDQQAKRTKGLIDSPETKQLAQKQEDLAIKAKVHMMKEVDEELKRTTDAAFLDTALDGPKGIKGFTADLSNAYADWVNQRAAAKVSASFMKKKFADLDSKGVDGFIEFQNMFSKDPRFKDVKKYFDDKYALLQEDGIKFGYKTDYLPQLWENSEDEVLSKLFNSDQKQFTRRPGFTLQSIIPDYLTGLQLGLTPRFKKISDLIGWYEATADKALADTSFFKYLGKNNFILPPSLAPKGWKTLNPDGFPTRKLTIGNTEYTGHFKAPPELADVINRYLEIPPKDLLGEFAKFASLAKNIVLSAGIPYTGLNAHGLNILARHLLDSKNPISGFLSGAYYLLSPNSAEKFLDKLGPVAVDAVKNGLTISTEEHAFDDMTGKIGPIIPDFLKKYAGGFLEKTNTMFDAPLFQKIIPAIKVSHYQVILDDLKKSYPEDEAKKIAASLTNDIFGGVNWDALARSPRTRQLLQSGVLAPDWFETNLKTGAGIAKGIFQPGNKKYRVYRRIFRNLLFAYIGANVANNIFSGHPMWQNDSGHTFEIEFGKTSDGKKRYFRPFGTAADFLRLPYDIALSVAKGDLGGVARVIRNRLSIPLAAAASLVFNTDYRGNPIFGKDRFFNPIPVKQQVAGVAGQLADVVVPQYGQALIDLAGGRIGWEEALSQSLELPFRYSIQNPGKDKPSSRFAPAAPQTKSKNGKATRFAP